MLAKRHDVSQSVSFTRRSVRSIAITALFLAGIAPPLVHDASAQYFGRNQVRYRTFKYQVLKTEHFDIYYYPEEEKAIREAARMAERWYTRLSTVLDHQLSGAAAARALRQPSGLRADQHADGRAGRGHRRRHRGAEAPHRAPARGSARRHRSRHRPRAGPRLPVRHHTARRRGELHQLDGDPDAAVVHRGHGRVPVDRSGRSLDRDVDARRGDRQPDPDHPPTLRSALLPLPLRSSAVGLHRADAGAIRWSGRSSRRTLKTPDAERAIQQIIGVSARHAVSPTGTPRCDRGALRPSRRASRSGAPRG